MSIKCTSVPRSVLLFYTILFSVTENLLRGLGRLHSNWNKYYKKGDVRENQSTQLGTYDTYKRKKKSCSDGGNSVLSFGGESGYDGDKHLLRRVRRGGRRHSKGV